MIMTQKLCSDCKHFAWEQRKPGDMPAVYEQGDPTCRHPNGWSGVSSESIGSPLLIQWARGKDAVCGPDGNNFAARLDYTLG